MERVEGTTFVAYCDEHRLTIRQRVELLIQICKGVQHAHQKGIIHRDLKPSNVLVADSEGRAVPKIIDFGIAKALPGAMDQIAGGATAVLTSHGVIGTPAYMSPEALNGDDLDTRTDVYSLGVMLYELLAGVRPHKVDDLPLAAVIRTVSENDTALPRTLFRTQTEGSRRSIADARGEDERSLAHKLSGDLGWIARKATARDREERYGSAADLASDLERHLSDQPVVAAPPSLRVRATKFVRRHRLVSSPERSSPWRWPVASRGRSSGWSVLSAPEPKQRRCRAFSPTCWNRPARGIGRMRPRCVSCSKRRPIASHTN